MDFITRYEQRWKTAAILLLVVGFVYFANSTPLTWLFLGAVYLISFKEAMALFGVDDGRLYIFASALWIVMPFYPHPTDLFFAAVIILASLTAYRRDFDSKALLPLLYPTAGMLFVWLLYRDYGMHSLLWIVAIVAATDVGAFYGGKRYGRRAFSPTSPNKTVEGVFSGVAAGTLAGLFLMIGEYNIFINALFVAFATSVAGIFGDLFESYLKREAGVKDSGNLLPGHGGVLDRADGYLFASAALYILLRLTGS